MLASDKEMHMKILFALAFIALAGLSVIGMAGAILIVHPVGLIISATTMIATVYALIKANRLV